jgi:hypothetical protein
MCVLGVAGGVLPNPAIIQAYAPEKTVVAGMLSVAFSLVAAAVIALVRRQKPNTWWLRSLRPFGALALGGAALAVPAYLAWGL